MWHTDHTAWHVSCTTHQVRQGLLAHTQYWQHQQQQLVLGSSLPTSTVTANGVSAGPTAAAVSEGKVRIAYNLSWAVNILLFGAKIYAFYVSHSKAVLASMVDSIVDLVSQVGDLLRTVVPSYCVICHSTVHHTSSTYS